ncbi:hypothetical protein SAMN04489732_113216 [Amycolatopsis saalfeldensis]|uniref:Uncharacterized protein n=1 Tax=Amycolatopsis saalfeldensis TaxID=394193 RepID=A0A1H8YCK4_9PSEU|nr:hypothetical protein SAMN04489732_113216 [Amycolatopsis saalfeldensis]
MDGGDGSAQDAEHAFTHWLTELAWQGVAAGEGDVQEGAQAVQIRALVEGFRAECFRC